MPDITSSVLIVNSRLFDGFPVPAIQTILHIKTRYKGFYVQTSNANLIIVMSHSEDLIGNYFLGSIQKIIFPGYPLRKEKRIHLFPDALFPGTSLAQNKL